MKTLHAVLLTAAPIALAGVLTTAPTTHGLACGAVTPADAQPAKFTSSALSVPAAGERRDLYRADGRDNSPAASEFDNAAPVGVQANATSIIYIAYLARSCI